MRVYIVIGVIAGILGAQICLAQTSDSDALNSICARSLRSYFESNLSDSPVLRPTPTPTVSGQAYQYISYRGKAVPLPLSETDWFFVFTDTVVMLGARDSNVTYFFGPTTETVSVDDVARWIPVQSWPAPSLEPLEFLRRAVSLDPNELECNRNSIQDTINDVSALILKTAAFSRFDLVYEYRDGLLAYLEHDNEESWRYVFEDPTSRKLFQVGIDVRDRSTAPKIGFEISDTNPSSYITGPSWLRNFFMVLNEPGADNLLALRDSIKGFGLPPESVQSVDRMIDAAAL